MIPTANGFLHEGDWVQYQGNTPINVWHERDQPDRTLVMFDYPNGWRIERVYEDGAKVAWAAGHR